MILILAGTREARELCALVSDMDVTASLAGVTEAPFKLGVPSRVGGFGGGEQFLEYCKNNMVEGVVDATHPFAAKITERTHRICTEAGIPYLRLERPAWGLRQGWLLVADAAAAVQVVPKGARVFLATGRQTLGAFAGLDAAEVYVRVVDETGAPFPFPNGRFVFGLPSSSVEEEKALFSMLGIEWLITKNAGGSDAKLSAAEELGIKVVMIERPKLDIGGIVETPAEAAAWVRARCG